MPASATMPAPFGRVMSGRGFAPGSFQPHDIPAAGQYTKDLPVVGNRPSVDAWLQQAKMAKNLQLFGTGFLNNSVPATPGSLSSVSVGDIDIQNPAKRPRLSIPEYGRSASDPPLSFARRHANSMDMPAESLKLETLRRTAGPNLPQTLRAVQSGHVRSADGRPSPNYRIYSNAFQGGRVTGKGPPLNYSHSKADNASLAKAAVSNTQSARTDPTPHPALLKQPLLGKRPSSNGTAHDSAQQQQPNQAAPSEAAEPAQQLTGPELSVAQAELTARLQHMQSIVKGTPVHSLSVNPKPKPGANPSPTVSPKQSMSHDVQSSEDTELDDASHGSHGPSQEQAVRTPASSEQSAHVAMGKAPVADAVMEANDKSPQGCARRSPVHSSKRSPTPPPSASRDCSDGPSPRSSNGVSPWDGAGPHFNAGRAFGDGADPRSRNAVSPLGGVSPKAENGMVPGDRAGPLLGLNAPSELRLPSRNSGSGKSDLIPRVRSERPWSNLSSALQPSVSGPVTKSEPVTTAQLQSIMASMKKSGDQRDDGAATVTEADVERWLSQLSEASVQGKGQKPILPGMTSQELFAAQNPNLPRPIQAQLHVMRAGFNRVSRPNMPGQPQLPPYSPPPVTTAFPPAASEHHRGLLAPNYEPDIPRVASANSLQPSLISSSTRSSLPPSVASWLEQDHQQQRQQQPGRGHVGMTQQAGYGFGREPGQGQTVGAFSAANSGYGQHTQSAASQGYAQTARPLDSTPVTGGKDWFDSLGSGYSLPSRVIAEGTVRNPALLNRPVLASHRDPQPDHRDPASGLYRAGPRVQQGHSVLPQAPSRSFSFLNDSSAQRAQQDTLTSSPAGPFFPPNFSAMQAPGATATAHALAAMLGSSNLSSADVSQLCSLAGNTHAGNLNQLISQLQMARQLAQAQGQSSPPLVETTHRVVIPAAHLKEGSHAVSRQNVASLSSVPNPAASVADGRRPHQGTAVEASPSQPKSALDVVAEAAAEAAEAANEEHSELLMLAAETLAGLNNMQSRSSGDHHKPASTGLDHSSSESPAAARKPSKHPANVKQRSRKLAPSHRPVQTSSLAATYASGSGATVHPVLGLYVPHARRSYHRDGTALGVKGGLMGNGGVSKGKSPFASSRLQGTAPAHGRQRKAAGSGPPAGLRRMPSDSSMTVSADSTA